MGADKMHQDGCRQNAPRCVTKISNQAKVATPWNQIHRQGEIERKQYRVKKRKEGLSPNQIFALIQLYVIYKNEQGGEQ